MANPRPARRGRSIQIHSSQESRSLFGGIFRGNAGSESNSSRDFSTFFGPSPPWAIAAPQRRGENAAPQRREEIAAPQRREEIAAPQRRGENAAPQRREEIAAPQRRGENAAPQRREEIAAPQRREEIAAPQRRGEIATSERQREHEESISDLDEVCLAVCHAIGRIGAAYYDSKYGRIHVFEDVVESYATCDILKELIRYIEPENVIASAKQDEKVMFHLKQLCIAPATGANPAGLPEPTVATDSTVSKPRLTLLRAWDFGYTNCKKRIYTVIGNSSAGAATRQNGNFQGEQVDTESRLRAAFAVNFDASCMVRALGALLKYLNLSRIGLAHSLLHSRTASISTAAGFIQEEEEIQRSDGIFGIQKFTLERTLSIDMGTFEALQIFQQQYHPSVYKAGRAGIKEGNSLFNMCNYCQSGPGTLEFRRWFQRPLSDIQQLRQRLDTVEFLADDRNSEIVHSMSKTLRQVHHVTSILTRLQLSKASARDWASLYKSLMGCSRLRDLIRITRQRPQLLTGLASTIGEEVDKSSRLLMQTVDFEGSRKENRFVVKAGLDEELDARRSFYAQLPTYLVNAGATDPMVLQIGIKGCGLTYLPLLGYLLFVPLVNGPSREYERLLQNGRLQVIFEEKRVAHCKCDTTRKLDQELGDTKFNIIDRETSIMLNVQSQILESAGALLEAVQSAAQLDCLISLALAARQFGWTKPNIVAQNVIDIQLGRHPLLEIFNPNEQFVPNPVKSGGFSIPPVSYEAEEVDEEPLEVTRLRDDPVVHKGCLPKVHVITGPNASGKSVYLKQVGLLTYMAHVGCFVPAAKADIGVFDSIYTRLRTMDSISGGFSSFAIDLRQMSEAVKNAGGRSLVLIDEFGKGTSTDVGAGLLAASLEYWIGKGDEQCPHVYLSSHLYCIIGLLPTSQLLEYQTMSIAQNNAGLQFLYKIVSGTITSSMATHIAEEVGLPASVIERAKDVFENIRDGRRTRRRDMSEEQYQCLLEKMLYLANRFLAMDIEDKTLPLKEALQEIVQATERFVDRANTIHGGKGYHLFSVET